MSTSPPFYGKIKREDPRVHPGDILFCLTVLFSNVYTSSTQNIPYPRRYFFTSGVRWSTILFSSTRRASFETFRTSELENRRETEVYSCKERRPICHPWRVHSQSTGRNPLPVSQGSRRRQRI